MLTSLLQTRCATYRFYRSDPYLQNVYLSKKAKWLLAVSSYSPTNSFTIDSYSLIDYLNSLPFFSINFFNKVYKYLSLILLYL